MVLLEARDHTPLVKYMVKNTFLEVFEDECESGTLNPSGIHIDGPTITVISASALYRAVALRIVALQDFWLQGRPGKPNGKGVHFGFSW